MAGYTAFGEFMSDHRCLWIDVTSTSLYGFKTPKIPKLEARRLQCSIPNVKYQWIRLYKEQLNKHKVIQKQLQLEADINGSLTPQQQEQFESILTIGQECMQYADNNCRKLYMGNVPFVEIYFIL